MIALGLGMALAMLIKAKPPLSWGFPFDLVWLGLSGGLLLGVPINAPGGALFLWLGFRIGRARGWIGRGGGARFARCGLAGGLLNSVLAAGPPLLMNGAERVPPRVEPVLSVLGDLFMLPWALMTYPLGLGFGILAAIADTDPSRLLTGLMFAFPVAGLAGGAVYGWLAGRRTGGQ